MSIEKIEINELREFAEQAKSHGWNTKWESGILYLSDHKVHSNLSICWHKGNESWGILNTKTGQMNIIPVNELIYPKGIFF